MLKLIIFDLDGPILDSFGKAAETVCATAKKLSLRRPSPSNFVLGWGHPGMTALKKLFPEITDEKTKTFIKIWAKNEGQRKIPFVRGAKESLAKIKKRGFATALMTTRCHNLKFHLNGSGIEKYFDFFQSFDNPDVKKEKVHPNHIFHNSPKDSPRFFDNLTRWMKPKNIFLKEAVFIDDTLSGLNLIKKVGLPFVGVCTGPLDSKAKWLKYGNLEAKYVIKSIADLPDWLKKYERV